MCGRYALYKPLGEIAACFMAKSGQNDGSGNPLWDWTPNYNISPGTVVPVVAFDGQQRRKIVPMRWGLHPHWKTHPPEGRPLFNARVETASEKPSFRTPYRRRRALIPANGWFEWEGVEKPKTPYYISEAGAEITAFAGLWDQWRVDEGITLLSCTILTTSATGPIKHLHHRMPVRLPRTQWDNWLNWNMPADKIMAKKCGSDDVQYHDVDRTVGSGRAQGAQLIAPISA